MNKYASIRATNASAGSAQANPAPVDVLAVMEDAAFRIENLREIAGYEPSELPPKVREARAAVAEMIEACKARDVAEGVAIQTDIENGYGLCPEKARAAHIALTDANLRYYAALARVGGAK